MEFINIYKGFKGLMLLTKEIPGICFIKTCPGGTKYG